MNPSAPARWAPFLIALVGLFAVVTVTVVPGVFSVDDNNYLINVLALRQGRVTVANTAGLPPSNELLFFDPGPWTRRVDSTPVASVAPPLYAPIALPFSMFGWRGLVALNTLAFAATAAMVFGLTRRYALQTLTPWIAATAFALGGFSIEYAQGLWPHSLSVFLCFAGVVLACRVVEGGAAWMAPASGVLIGLATGVRYQNAMILGAVGLALLVLAWRRWGSVLLYGIGAAVPLAVSAAINHARIGSWNPISKGPGYLDLVLPGGAGSWADPARLFWARLVDFSVRPPLVGPDVETWMHYEPVTGAHLMVGLVAQKAFLQSAPWAVLGLLALILAWAPSWREKVAGRSAIRVFGVVAVVVLGVFAISGVRRHEGYSFNQRYLLELVPMLAVATAVVLDRVRLPARVFALSALAGALAVLLLLGLTPISGGPSQPLWLWRIEGIFKVPLLLAGVLGVSWLIALRWPNRSHPIVAALAGVSLGWAFFLHVGDDVAASDRARRSNQQRTQQLARMIPDHSAVFAFWWHKDPIVPLLFEKDVVILDLNADQGKDATRLLRDLSASRRVFIIQNDIPDALRRDLIGSGAMAGPDQPDVIEITLSNR